MAERDHDDKRRRVDELVSPVSTVAQDEVSTLSTVHFDSETRDDEIAVSVALPEEPVLQSVCSHGHKLQLGDVQQAFIIGDPISRGQPLFVRMPPDGIPGESREVWVQLLKTVNGLADGTREWRNCFLATARGIGFETSVLEPCVLVLRGSQQRYNGIIGVADEGIAGGGNEVREQAISKLKKRFNLVVGKWERENSVRERLYKQQMDPCVLGNLWKNEEGTIGRCKRN